MQEVDRALDEVKNLYTKVLGQPAPEIESRAYISFPPGVDPVEHTVQEVARLKQLTETMADAPDPVAWVPPADTFATPKEFVMRVEIPGVERDEVKVFVTQGQCVVRGTRKVPLQENDTKPMTLERPWGAFERRFPLPAGCYPDRTNAHYADGVLEVRVIHEGAESPKEMKVDVA